MLVSVFVWESRFDGVGIARADGGINVGVGVGVGVACADCGLVRKRGTCLVEARRQVLLST